jgi:hypothetical protein
VLLALGCVGCGPSGPELAPVSGRITLDGQPLSTADIIFQPDESKSPSYGRTDSDGRYELGYKRGVAGALLGQHTVRISVSHELVRNPPKIPARYDRDSTLREEVKPGQNEINFDLTTKAE